MQLHDIDMPEDNFAEFCRRHRVERLCLFGSILRDDFQPDSDVDVLVEFCVPVRIGILGMARLERELSQLIGRKVDLRTPPDLSALFRDEVVRTAMVLHAA